MSRKQEPLTVEYLLLGLIRQTPIHAYDLFKRVSSDEELNCVWHFNQSQLYATLDKIEKNKMIVSEISHGSAFPFRKVYSLTEQGDDMFCTWKETPVRLANSLRSDFMAKLYFLKDEPLEQFEEVLNKQIKVCQEARNANQENLDNERDSEYRKMIFRYRIETMTAAIDWLEECIRNKKAAEA